MCILFLYVAKHSSRQLKRNQFKVILATNRDEFYSRPAKPANFWESDPDILAGQDLQSGGTWFGMNVKTRKIAALLNITGGTDPTKSRISRGSLITNFLRSTPGLTGWTYCRNLNQDPSLDIREKFDQFNLLTIDLLTNNETSSTTTTSTTDPTKPENRKASSLWHSPLITYLTNYPDCEPNPVSCESTITSLGNDILNKPYLKVSEGGKIFQDILEKHHHSGRKLKSELLQFLKSPQRFYPDSRLEAKFQGQSTTEGNPAEVTSSIYLHIPEVNYGTRTHTLILIDFEDNVDFHEWTKEEPIDPHNEPVWRESNFKFHLGDRSKL